MKIFPKLLTLAFFLSSLTTTKPPLPTLNTSNTIQVQVGLIVLSLSDAAIYLKFTDGHPYYFRWALKGSVVLCLNWGEFYDIV